MRPSISKTFQHGNVYFHPEYLMSSNIVMALAGDMMSVEDKTTIARTTWEALQEAGGGGASPSRMSSTKNSMSVLSGPRRRRNLT